MARTWSEIQTDISAAEAAIKAAEQKKAEAEAEAFFKGAPAALGVLGLVALVSWVLAPKAK